MKVIPNSLRANLPRMLRVLAVSALIAGGAAAAAPRTDESELLALGFKVLVATTPVQETWVKNLAPGKIRAMQRNGRKYFIYPDASGKQIYVGGPEQYAAYRKLHPEDQSGTQDAADKAAAYRLKQDSTMQKAAARDASDPYLGLSWNDLLW